LTRGYLGKCAINVCPGKVIGHDRNMPNTRSDKRDENLTAMHSRPRICLVDPFANATHAIDFYCPVLDVLGTDERNTVFNFVAGLYHAVAIGSAAELS
jgi:hypothetical protein